MSRPFRVEPRSSGFPRTPPCRPPRALALLAIFAALGSACAPRAEEIVGRVTPIDGDSFKIGAAEIRLYGVDAFEGRQSCGTDATRWACGEAAAEKLRELTIGRTVTCRERDTDTYGRTVAVCNNGSVDVGAEMVRSGLALAYRRYSDDYVDEENEAKAARRGAWTAGFVEPWDERRDGGGAPRAGGAVASDVPSSCRGTGIKGNINREGERIYHVPSSQSYADTVIDEAHGERWFCTEDAARRAGWRAPRGR